MTWGRRRRRLPHLSDCLPTHLWFPWTYNGHRPIFRQCGLNALSRILWYGYFHLRGERFSRKQPNRHGDNRCHRRRRSNARRSLGFPKVWPHTTINTSAGTPVTITLQAWDVELDSLNWVIVNTVGGTAEFALGTSNVTDSLGYSTIDMIFIPDPGFAGTGHVIFYVDDGNNASP